ncbi:hypothetical protein NYR60_02880 [Actinobacillus genomosp. 2]|uniref:hypothetical protein n=1 Tax=Actinobacillus genomosp. 2 TaxID=230709 RepID=UPI002442AD5A|nr:hypothetical protein [Actinobacillus genomosp. 2]WGE32571.1 hypothetical protein NYR60_02880 [Actinobacillus genomosp. 2]
MDNQQQYKICLEVIFKDENSLNQVEVNAKTNVLGGIVSRIDFAGSTFDDYDYFMDLFAPEQMTFLCARPELKERMQNAIYKSLDKLIDEIEFEEEEWYE